MTLREAKATGTTFYIGKVCAKHPELAGKRRTANQNCELCAQANARKRRKNMDPVAKKAYDRNKHMLENYGVSSAQIDLVLAAQGGRCAICKTKEPDSKLAQWHVDHDHDTGVLRGVLCSSCNLGLGRFKDSIPNLARAIDYLTECRSSPEGRFFSLLSMFGE